MDAKISISLMGNFALRVNGQRQNLACTGSTKNIFMLLASRSNKTIRREYLADQIWTLSSPARARSALNTALWRIKKTLKTFPDIKLKTNDNLVKLKINSAVSVDTHQLKSAVEFATRQQLDNNRLTTEAGEKLNIALGNCHGEFLEDCDEHWVLAERERHAAYHVRAQTLAMHHAANRGLYEIALAHGRDILSVDAFREGTQREVMWLYVLNSQRAQALRQYEMLETLLKKELGVAPMPESMALYNHILKFEAVPTIKTGTDTNASMYTTIAMLQTLKKSRLSLMRALIHTSH